MFSMSVLMLNIILLINAEIKLFFFSFEKSQASMLESLKKMKLDTLIPFSQRIENHEYEFKSSFQKTFSLDKISKVTQTLDYIEFIIDHSESNYLKHMSLLSKVTSVVKFFHFFEYLHLKSLRKISHLTHENEILLSELRSVIDGLRDYTLQKESELRVYSKLKKTVKTLDKSIVGSDSYHNYNISL